MRCRSRPREGTGRRGQGTAARRGCFGDRRQRGQGGYPFGLQRDALRPSVLAGHRWSATVRPPLTRTEASQRRSGSRRRSPVPTRATSSRFDIDSQMTPASSPSIDETGPAARQFDGRLSSSIGDVCWPPVRRGYSGFAPKASRRPSQSFTTNSRECQGVLERPRVNSTLRVANSA